MSPALNKKHLSCRSESSNISLIHFYKRGKKMKLIAYICVLSACLAVISGQPGRAKRDVTCASLGHRGCNWSCKLRGWQGGECGWNDTTAAYNCKCDQVKRGIRCNVGGDTTCHLSCVLLGHTRGDCDGSSNCKCSGINTSYGDMLTNIGNRL